MSDLIESKLKYPQVKVPDSIKNREEHTKELELKANLVSALGVISQPEDESHDRLQSLVEDKHTDAMSPKGNQNTTCTEGQVIDGTDRCFGAISNCFITF